MTSNFPNIDEDLSEYDEWYKKEAHRQIGRYQGWKLLGNAATKELKEIPGSESYIESKGYKIRGWESISNDEDDKGDFGIKRK